MGLWATASIWQLFIKFYVIFLIFYMTTRKTRSAVSNINKAELGWGSGINLFKGCLNYPTGDPN